MIVLEHNTQNVYALFHKSFLQTIFTLLGGSRQSQSGENSEWVLRRGEREVFPESLVNIKHGTCESDDPLEVLVCFQGRGPQILEPLI